MLLKTANFPVYRNMLLLIISFCFLATIAYGQNAKELVVEALEKANLGNSEMISTLIIRDKRSNERIRQLAIARKDFPQTKKMLMKFLKPNEVAGTIILIHDHEFKDDDTWIYLPSTGKVRRLLSTEKAKRFMGSEFQHADFSIPDHEKFNYKYLGTEVLNGHENHKIEVSCKDKSIIKELEYSKKLLWIQKNTGLTNLIHYLNENTLIRIQKFENYQKASKGKFYAKKILINNLKNKRSSIMTIDKWQSGSEMNESEFSPSLIEKHM